MAPPLLPAHTLSLWCPRPSAPSRALPSPVLQMRQLVEGCFGDWAPPAGQPAPPQLPNPVLPDQAGVAGRIFLVDVPGATQASRACQRTRSLQQRYYGADQ